MQAQTISLYTNIPHSYQVLTLSDAQKHEWGTQPLSQVSRRLRADFASHVNVTFALPGPRDIPEDAFIPHHVYPSSGNGSEASLLDSDENLESIETFRKGELKIAFHIDETLKGKIVPRHSIPLASGYKGDIGSSDSPWEEGAVETQTPSENSQKNKKKKRKRGKGEQERNTPLDPSGTGGAMPDAVVAMLDAIRADLDTEKKERKQELERERKDREEEMERMRAQHATEKAALEEREAAVNDELQDLHNRYREICEAFTEDDHKARDHLMRRVLLDYGRDCIREKVYDERPSKAWNRWPRFIKRFGASMDVFVAQTLPKCKERGIMLSEDALKGIWESQALRNAGNGVAHGDVTKIPHLEHAINTLPKDSTDRNVLTEIFVCKFGYAPTA